MIRRYVLFIVSLLTFSGSLVAALATTIERNFELRGYVDPIQDSNLPYRIPRFGVNADLTQYDDGELNTHLQWMQEAHITWIRQFAYWDVIEQEKGQFDWSAWDQIVEAVDRYPEMQLVAVLMNTPIWVRSEESPTAPPDRLEDFAAFARVFAQRYGRSINHYQIWDEPNLDDAWGDLKPNASQYVALLDAGYHAIHGNDEGATVLAAALAPTVEVGGQNISDWLYLESLYQLGAADVMDAVAAKPYGFDFDPLDRRVGMNRLNFSRIVALREIMVAHGDSKKALWASNWGWNNLPQNWAGVPSIWGSASPEEQINHTLTALDRADREWAWLGGMIIHHWQPNAPINDPVWGFSLIDQQDNPTPLWTALTQRQQPQSAENGLYHPLTSYARYSGVWEFSQRGADIGWLETSDSQLEFDFKGREIAMLLREGDYFAFLYPRIDSEQANAVPKDSSGNAYIFLRSETLEPELNLIPVSKKLVDGEHTLQVIADKGWDQWALAGYAVSSGNLAIPYNNQITIAWLTASIAAIAVIITGWQLPWHRFMRSLHGLWQPLHTFTQVIISALTSIALMIGLLLTWNHGVPEIFRREEVYLGLSIVTGGILYVAPGILLAFAAIILLFGIFFHRPIYGLLLTIFWSPFFLFPVELFQFSFPIAGVIAVINGGAYVLRLMTEWGRTRQSANSQLNSNALYFSVFDIISFTSLLVGMIMLAVAGKLPQSPSAAVMIGFELVLILAILRNIRLQPLDYGVILWLALGFLSLIWAAQLAPAVDELRKVFLEPALFYVILRHHKLEKQHVRWLIYMLVLAGLTVAVIGLFQFARGEAIITAENGARRLASVYGSPNNVALFLGRCIPFLVAYILIPIRNQQTWFNQRILTIPILAIMLVTVVLTQSVGALILGIPASLIAIFVLVWGKRAWLPTALLVIGGVIVLAILTQVSPRFASLLDFTDGTNFIRLRVWESALNVIHDYPVTGLGLDQFLYAFQSIYIRPDVIWESQLSHPHNVILDFWIRLGISGVVLFLGIQFAFWSSIRQSIQQLRQNNPQLMFIAIGIAGSMVNLLVHGLIDNSVFVIDLAFVFILLLALTSTLQNLRSIDASTG